VSYVPASLRQTVWERASGCCEYCLVPDQAFIFPHEVDHIDATQHGGSTVTENLAVACFDCNRHKGTNLASLDPETGQRVFLFHPRHDKWSEHFRLVGARIIGFTAAGRATVSLLQLNLPDRILVRTQLQRANRYPRSAQQACD
jgi:hypothetical protein